MTQPSFAFVSLGCPKNLVDSEKMLGVLKQSGFELVNEDQRPDAIVVNTCGFLSSARDESLEVVREALRLKEAGQVRRVVVAGCERDDLGPGPGEVGVGAGEHPARGGVAAGDGRGH